jgi:hypothetical protein
MADSVLGFDYLIFVAWFWKKRQQHKLGAVFLYIPPA